MPRPKKNKNGPGEIPLQLAKKIKIEAEKAWSDGRLLQETTQVTQDLFHFWFDDSFKELRSINFNEGQRRSILNVIYLHELVRPANILDMYKKIAPDLAAEIDFTKLNQGKNSHPKYAVKMATGTGKTWVLHALLIWQYLNSRHEEDLTGRYTTNFLIVTPGLIIYERMQDAFFGKQNPDGTRDFEQSDFKKFQELFIPPAYRDEVFGFIRSSVALKEEIGKKVTGDGLIAITNWHALVDEEEEELTDTDLMPLEDTSVIIDELLPIRPGTTAGHDLNTLDAQFLRGISLDYLAELPSILVFNDEAHHIHEFKKEGLYFEVEWQKSLNRIAEKKRGRYLQIDFSATPYKQEGTGDRARRHYFPHIISDYDLKEAIRQGEVKIVALDKRKEIATLPLDFKAVREGRRTLSLSEGQKVMLRAGLSKIKILEEEFVKLTEDKEGQTTKRPKMFIVCEDTSVPPLVTEFLIKIEGLPEDDVIEIHSDRKGRVPEAEWNKIKQRLFNIDKYEKPRIIVSVLMLREGFDVNNICVVVPLRIASAEILLEQIIGRGLRQMWREPEYAEVKQENREKLLIKKEAPTNYIDLLSIIEHPKFLEFYKEYIEEGLIGEVTTAPKAGKDVLGDMITVELKQGYKRYDLYIPIIIHDHEETLIPTELKWDELEPFPIDLETLKTFVPKEGDVFYSEEVTVKTRFGEYTVTGDIFNSKSYNEYLQKLVTSITLSLTAGGRGKRDTPYPLLQINNYEIARLCDNYIRNRLFKQQFNPLEGNNWRVLLLTEQKIIEHVVRNISKAVYDLLHSTEASIATVAKRYFSEVPALRLRENYSIPVSKCIYPRLPYPSNKGGLEKAFMEAVDRDSDVEAFIKIKEFYHDFAHILYIREDGLLSRYYPDFIVRLPGHTYIVETKGEHALTEANVRQKRRAALDFVESINRLYSEDRMNSKWHYVLLGENTFYSYNEKGATIKEILDLTILTKDKLDGKLTGFLI